MMIDYKAELKSLHLGLCNDGMEQAQRRALERFALLQLAGNIAIDADVLPLSKDEVRKSVKAMAQNWIENTDMLSDIERGIINIKNYIELYPGRFRDAMNSSGASTSTAIAGYRHERAQLFYFTEEGFKDACGGHNHAAIAKELRNRQLLDTNDSGRLKKKVQIAGLTTRPYVYAVREAILEIGNEPSTAPESEANEASGALSQVRQVPPPQSGKALPRAPF